MVVFVKNLELNGLGMSDFAVIGPEMTVFAMIGLEMTVS